MRKTNRFDNSYFFWNKVYKLDWILLITIILLCLVGVGTLYSASSSNWNPWALNHAYRCVMGFLILFAIALTNPKLYLKFSYHLYVISILSLIYVEFFGVGNVKRWISFGFFNIQPSEITKIALILFLAKFFEDFPSKANNILHYLIPFLAVLAPTLIVIKQPDLGTGFMIFILGVTLIFLKGLPWRIVLLSLFISLASIPILWQSLYDYQKSRIIVFLNPHIDNLGSGYQIMQSKIAIGSGGIFGKGYLLGSQTRLDFLPEKHTDFVFTLIAEEMGFIGGIILISLFVILIYRLLNNFLINKRLSDKIIIFGVSYLIFLYVTLNIGMVSGLLPVVGAPLPFISHGGTSLLTVFISIGVVMGIRINKDYNSLG